MGPEQYKKAAIRTENTPNFILKHRALVNGNGMITDIALANDQRNADDLRLSRIMHAILGMITELGELCDPVKRHLVYGAPLDFNSNEKGSVREESGDLAWYHDGLFLDAIDAKLEDIWERNIAKLRARFPDKFTEDKAINRDLEAEGKALSSVEMLTSFQHPHHAMEALTRVAHALGVDAPRELVSGSNKRLADLCVKQVDDYMREIRSLNDRLTRIQVGLQTLSMG